MAHEQRSHALLSASGSHRWLNCTPSAKLEKGFADTTSEAAKEGTLAHELAEQKLIKYFKADTVPKRQITSKINALKKSELYQPEMDGHTDKYVDYIKSISLKYDNSPTVIIEARLDLTNYIKDGFGTADCILIGGGTLQVVDLKYGKGVPVSAERNSQLMIYALGALERYSLIYDIQHIVLSIVQPRLSETASEYELSAEELRAFGEYVRERASLAYDGKGEFSPDEHTCRFCKAKAVCKARADKNTELWFNGVPDVKILSNEEIGEYLKKGKDVAAWVSDLKDYALAECLAGRPINGWKAVEGRSTRKWSNEDLALNTLIATGVDSSLLYETKPLTLAKIEKLVSTEEMAAVADYIIKPPGSPTLVEESDKRKAINTIEEAFKGVEVQ